MQVPFNYTTAYSVTSLYKYYTGENNILCCFLCTEYNFLHYKKIMWIARANYFSFEDGPRYTTYLAPVTSKFLQINHKLEKKRVQQLQKSEMAISRR
jgi:hypothetical protein